MAGTSLSLQDVSIAADAYEAAGELSRATILQLMTKIDDSNLLAGQVLSFLGDLDRARELSLLSRNSIQALDLSIQLEEEGDEVEFACQVHNEEQLILCMVRAQVWLLSPSLEDSALILLCSCKLM